MSECVTRSHTTRTKRSCSLLSSGRSVSWRHCEALDVSDEVDNPLVALGRIVCPALLDDPWPAGVAAGAGRPAGCAAGPAPAAAGGVGVLGSRTHRAGHGTIQPPASRAMIAGMGKAQDPGPGSRVDNPQDVEITGDLPMSLTTFVGRERELDEIGRASCRERV